MKCLSTLLCLANAWVVAFAWPWAKEEGPLQVVKEPIDVGRPVLIEDIAAFETRCFKAAAPRNATVFRAVASVVALAGSPALSGGWQPTRPALNSSETGYETMDQVMSNTDQKCEFFVCVTTFSSQGCDSMLTVLLLSAEEAAPLVQLRPNFPSVWPLGPAPMSFSVEMGVMEDTRVTALPVSGGSIAVQVYPSHNATGCSGQPIEVDGRGAAIVDVPRGFTSGFSKLCIVVQGLGDVLMTAGPPTPGPFLVPAIPFAGRLQENCETARIWVNNGTDVTVTVAAEDASALMLSGTLSTDVQQAPSLWKGLVPPGGNGAALVIEGKRLSDAKLFHGIDSKEEVAVLLSICQKSRTMEAQATRYWITSVTETGVVTLQDGIPAFSSVPSSAETWREFRLLMTSGKVTVAATSHGKVQLVADTKRPSRSMAAFRWESGGNSSRAVLHLTTDPKLANSEVHLVDCRLPCFLHLAAHAFVPGDEADVPFTVVASTSLALKFLVQGLEVEQDLEPGEAQVYAYSLPRNDTAVVVSVTRHHGKATFRVSASPDFPEGPTTTARADAVILLEPSSGPLVAAVQQSEGRTPVLYVRVDGGETSSSSLVCARSEGHAKWLLSGVPTEGAVKAGRYDRHRFFISPAEASQNVTVTVDVSLYRGGGVTVFAACDPNQYPWEEHYDWGGYISGQGSMTFNSFSKAFKSGWIYLSITGHELAAYSLRVRWDSEAVQLKDGVPEKGRVAAGTVRWFSFATHLLPEPRAISLRAQAVAGDIGLCVREYRQISGLAQLVERLGKGLRHRKMSWMEQLSCVYSTSATSLAGAEDSIAALDLPMSQGTSIELGILHLDCPSEACGNGDYRLGAADETTKVESEFSVMAVAGDIVILPEVQSVIIDSLGPGCCVKSSLQRSYRRFLRVPSCSLQLRVAPLGKGTLLPDTRFSLRAGAALEGGWFKTVQPNKEGLLQMKVEVKELLPTGKPRGFWVEAQLEVPQPLNYTLSFQHEVATDAKLPATRLPANVPVPSNLSQADFAYFTFQAGKAASHLCLRQCFGQVELQLELNGSDVAPKVEDENPIALRGNCTAVTGRGDGAISSVLVRKVSVAPSNFEIELTTRADERIQLENPVLNVSDFKLCDASRSCEFSITISFASASIGLASSGLASEPTLRYEVLAMEVDPDLHPNTSCGLRAVMEHKRAISRTAVQVGRYSWQHQLQGVLEFEKVDFANRSIVVNVLASLVLPQGQIYAVAGYRATQVVPALLRSSSTADHTLAYMMAIVALIIVLLMITRGRSKGEARSLPELEMAYDLHEGERSLLEQPGHGGYVPPSV